MPAGKRILFVAPQPFYEDRGTPIAIRQVLEALAACGEEVDLLTFPVGQHLALPGLRISRPSIGFRPERVPIGFSLAKLLLDAGLTLELARRLDPARYKLVHAVEEAAFPAVLLGRRRGVPVLYDMQSSLPEQLEVHALFRPAWMQRALRACERWVIRHADVVVCSAGLTKTVQRADPGARVREWQFVSEIDAVGEQRVAGLRQELGLTADARIVLYAGNFAPYQGVPLLLAATATVLARVPGAVFLLVGDTGDGSGGAAEALASDGVRILPRIPRRELGGYLALADVVVSPRIAGDNLPPKIFDYLAAGRPIVATDLPVHRRVLNEDIAVLVPPTQQALADAIIRLLREPQRAAAIAARARARADAHFSRAAFRRLIAEVYGMHGLSAGASSAHAPSVA